MTEGVRRLLLDISPGERRGVVLLDGRPERLLIERDGEPPRAELGARVVGRVRGVAGRRAFVALPDGPDGAVALGAEAINEGAALELEVTSEAHAEKGPRLRLLGPAQGPPRRLAEAPPLVERLRDFAPDAAVETGAEAREAADLAQETALAVEHRFRAGLALTIEPTRALVAIDVDLAAGEGAGVKRVREANLSAIRHAARLARLKALSGVIVIDLLGFPPPDVRGLLRAEAERAFAPDGAEVVVTPPDRFGLLHVSKPRRERPVAEVLLAEDGELSARTVAQRLVRDALREARADPGARLAALAPPDVIAALRSLPPLGRAPLELREVAGPRTKSHIAPA